jgi:nitrogen-specific signal transduction histidine kinase/CheY-like chemotaxis protein
VLAFNDITERKRLEQQFLQAQKMEAIGRLAGGVAHDFNNLLTVITGYGEVLLHGIPADDPARELVGEILTAAEKAAALTRQLLAFGRKQMFSVTVLNLNGLLTRVEPMLRRLIRENIELLLPLGPQLRPVKADSNQIEQVILNLTLNARDAMPTGGRLTIATANVELDEAFAVTHAEVKPGPYTMVSVSDTGAGMDASTKARLFEPFFTTKEVGRGTGLGLATAYGIIKQSGGYIDVESEPDQGARFTIYLPSVGEAPVASEGPPADRQAPAGGEVVLVVEDQAEIRSVVRQILERSGYTVLEAGQGIEALAVSDRHAGPIHLLVTDMIMPHMSGRELADQLARLRPALRILFLSGYTDDAVLRDGVLESGSAFLQKPFTPQALLQRVRELLNVGS